MPGTGSRISPPPPPPSEGFVLWSEEGSCGPEKAEETQLEPNTQGSAERGAELRAR